MRRTGVEGVAAPAAVPGTDRSARSPTTGLTFAGALAAAAAAADDDDDEAAGFTRGVDIAERRREGGERGRVLWLESEMDGTVRPSSCWEHRGGRSRGLLHRESEQGREK